MSEKFNPARPDKHAANPKRAQDADREQRDNLDKGLEGSFPASNVALCSPFWNICERCDLRSREDRRRLS
jgi:hypothetical protein